MKNRLVFTLAFASLLGCSDNGGGAGGSSSASSSSSSSAASTASGTGGSSSTGGGGASSSSTGGASSSTGGASSSSSGMGGGIAGAGGASSSAGGGGASSSGGGGGASSSSSSSSTSSTTSGASGDPCACPVGKKLLKAYECVDINDPAYGCDPLSFSPCGGNNGNLHAQFGCSNGACSIAQCDAGWADCNQNPTDGCEADLSSPATCLSCQTTCNQGDVCTPAGCSSACVPPLTNCQGHCVDVASDARHCGGGCAACPAPANAVPSCAMGVCGSACAPGFNGPSCLPAGDTCCGAACADCSALDVDGGSGRCVAGVCQTLCFNGEALCNGACVDTNTDAANCGGCGSPCAGICKAGVCDKSAKTTLATGSSPTSLLADGAFVYWVDNGGTSISKVDRDGAAAPVTLLSNGSGIGRLAQDAQYLYWAANLGGAVMKLDKSGGAPQIAAPATGPVDVAVDGSYVYWSEQGPPGAIKRALKTGGATMLVQTTNVLGHIEVDATNVFWSSPDFKTAPKDGSGVPTLLVKVGPPGGIGSLEAWDVGLDYVGFAGGQSCVNVSSVDRAATQTTSLFFGCNGTAYALETDQNWVYFEAAYSDVMHPLTGGLLKAPLCGGIRAKTKLPANALPAGLGAHDDLYLYLAQGAAIVRMAKP